MLAKCPRLKCPLLTLIGVVFLLPAGVEAQTRRSSITLTGTVSETVALSVLPNGAHDNVDMDVVSSGNTVRITLSGDGSNPSVIRVPLIVRSNSSFRILTTVESKTAELTQLSVTDVRATGTLVSPGAVSELHIPQHFDLQRPNENASLTNSLPLDVSLPFLLASGPRVSLGGTLDSPNNALQINLLIGLKLQTARGWMVHLTFVATAERLIQ